MAFDHTAFVGREVSCRALSITFDLLREENRSPHLLAESTGVPLSHLRNRAERVSWSAYETFMANASQVWDDDGFVRMGQLSVRSRALRLFVLPARMLYTARDFYHMMADPDRSPAKQLFTCIDNSLEEIRDDLLLIHITMQPGYAPCPQYLLATKGAIQSIPTALGLAPAEVEMTLTERGARYHVQVPPGGGALALVRRIATLPFTVRATARELLQSNLALHARYSELTEEIERRESLESQRRQLIGDLKAKNAELESFNYSVSHDLRAPLVTIQGFAGLAERDLEAGHTGELAQHLGRIRSAADRMGVLLEDLLALSRIGRVTEAPTAVALGGLVNEAIDLVASAVAERGVDIRVLDDLPVVPGDRTRLLQVLQNLLDNALKFLGAEPCPMVEIGPLKDADGRGCYVRDNGIGLDPAHQAKIFELFRRLDPEQPGTGIGLALARRIVDAHGGRLWVESEGQGHGSTFSFVLPTTPQ